MTTERPVQVKVVKVKKSDKGDFYKRQMAWELRDLSEVDAKDATKVRFRWWGVREWKISGLALYQSQFLIYKCLLFTCFSYGWLFNQNVLCLYLYTRNLVLNPVNLEKLSYPTRVPKCM